MQCFWTLIVFECLSLCLCMFWLLFTSSVLTFIVWLFDYLSVWVFEYLNIWLCFDFDCVWVCFDFDFTSSERCSVFGLDCVRVFECLFWLCLCFESWCLIMFYFACVWACFHFQWKMQCVWITKRGVGGAAQVRKRQNTENR